GGVGALYIAAMMLVVVQLHDASRNVRLERAVVVLKVRKLVLRHRVSFLSSPVFPRLQKSGQPVPSAPSSPRRPAIGGVRRRERRPRESGLLRQGCEPRVFRRG